MQTVDESHNHLWDDLESEFGEGNADPLILDLPDPPSRQRTMGVAGSLSLFNGYLPALGLSLFSGFLGLVACENRELGLLPAVTVLLAVILSSVFAVAFRGPRRSWPYYALTGILVGGVSELLISASEWFLVESFGTDFGTKYFPLALQRQMEGFYRLDHWLFYAALGIGLAYLTNRVKHDTPWMDSPPSGRFRSGLAACLLSLPLLLPLGCLLLASWHHERSDWYRVTTQSNMDLLSNKEPFDWNIYERWDNLHQTWMDSIPEKLSNDRPPGELYANTSLRALHEVEKGYLELSRDRYAGRLLYDEVRLGELLVSRLEDLQEPLQVSQSVALTLSRKDRWDASRFDLTVPWNALLKSLARYEMSPADCRQFLSQLESLDQNPRSIINEADREILNWTLLRSPFKYRVYAEALMLFGTPFHNSPSELWFAHINESVTRPWLELRHQMVGLEPEEQLSLLRKNGDPELMVQDHLMSRTYDFELRPLWRAAAVMTAIRMYKQDNGVWPTTISELKPQLWFEPDFSLTETADGLKLQDNSSHQSWVLK